MPEVGERPPVNTAAGAAIVVGEGFRGDVLPGNARDADSVAGVITVPVRMSSASFSGSGCKRGRVCCGCCCCACCSDCCCFGEEEAEGKEDG